MNAAITGMPSELRVVGVASGRRETAAEMADSLDGARPYDDHHELLADPEVSPTISTLVPFDQDLIHSASLQTESLELATFDEEIQHLPLRPSDITLTEPPTFVLAMMAIFTLLGGRHLVRRR